MNFNSIKSQAMVKHLVMQGAIEMAGIDEKGEMLYSITDKLELVNPEICTELNEAICVVVKALISSVAKAAI